MNMLAGYLIAACILCLAESSTGGIVDVLHPSDYTLAVCPDKPASQAGAIYDDPSLINPILESIDYEGTFNENREVLSEFLFPDPQDMNLNSPNITISINGPDNVGKTLQTLFLPDSFQICSGIYDYDGQMKALDKENNLRHWWFETASNEEFVSSIMRAVKNRWSTIPSKHFVVFDRGAVMFEAVCIARIAFKDQCDLKKAEQTYENIKKQLGISIPREDIRILLKHGKNLKESVEITLNREDKYDDSYKKYQELFQQQLASQESDKVYTNTINVTSMSVIQVQNEIRSIVNQYTNSKLLKPMFEHVTAIIAFGGLSEAGKSCLAEDICRKLDTRGIKSSRLKIGYFLEQYPDVYQLTPNKQAEFLIKQLDRYLQCHYWLRVITIESCHRLESTQQLQKFLGKLLQIVYVDASLETRKRRSCTDIDELVVKDITKISRGADRIKTETDCFVVYNEKNTVDECSNLIYDKLIQKYEAISLQELLRNRYSGKISLFSHQFVLSVGSVLIHKSQRRICLIHQLDGKQEWLLPKGRKDIDETLHECALRETYEETGFYCSLMPLNMETRATPSGNAHHPDVSRKLNASTEPFMIYLHKVGDSVPNHKIVFWYVTQVDEYKPRRDNTQMPNENFEARLVSLDEACDLLSFEEDRLLVQEVFKLFEDTYKDN